jgi:translation elongation factor EF-1beta
VYTAIARLPHTQLSDFPAVRGWANLCGVFAPSVRASWSGSATASTSSTKQASSAKQSAPAAKPATNGKKAPAVAAAAAAAVVDENDADDLFGDDVDDSDAPSSTEVKPSRAEQLASAKAAKDAKKKIERSQVVIDVKVWDTETDLLQLFSTIKSSIVMPGLVWAEGCNVVPVAFGVKKLVISCIIDDDKVGLNDITDELEAMEELIQSVDITTMSRFG